MSNILWVIISKRPVVVTLLDPMEFVDAVLNVTERRVWAFFALLRKIHIFIILVVFVNHSLKEATFSCEAHGLDVLRAIGFRKGASTNGATRKVCVITSFRCWRCKLQCCRCLLPILDVSHTLWLIASFNVTVDWTCVLLVQFVYWYIRFIKPDFRVEWLICHFNLSLWVVWTIVDPLKFIRMRCHFIFIDALLFVEFGLVNTRFCV